MEDRKKRANKRQQELLVERLYTNMEMARGNLADANVADLWANLTNELNMLGCSRTVQQWQHIWHSWVAKVKTKARKIRDSIRATGGGPALETQLTQIETKILSIIGTASIHGFANLEVGVPPPLSHTSPPASPPASPPLETEREVQQPQQPAPVQLNAATRRVALRRRLPRPYRHPQERLIESLEESNRTLQATIRHSAEDIAAALRDSSAAIAAAFRESSAATLRAAEILAASLSSARNSSHDMNQ